MTRTAFAGLGRVLLAALLLIAATLLGAGTPAAAASSAGSGITIKGRATPERVRPGALTTLSATVRSDTDLTGVIDIQVFNAGGQEVYRRYFVNETLPAGAWVRRTAPWNVTLIGGAYRVEVNVFDAGWTLLASDESAATLTVTSTVSPAPW